MVTDKLKKSMSKEVYTEIKRQILESQLKPGERLIEMTIAKELNVSRTPVREALKQLEMEGLVSTFPRKGSIVSKISVGSAVEMMQIRIYLESLACVLISRQDREKDLHHLAQQLSHLDKALEKDNKEKFWKCYIDWCFAIQNAVKNKPLKQMLNEVYLHIQRLMPVAMMKEERIQNSYDELLAIYDAIKAHDEEAIDEAVKVHNRHILNSMQKNVDYRNFKK